MQGLAGLDALTALLTATRAYVTAHLGRYTATTGTGFPGPGDRARGLTGDASRYWPC